MSPPVGLVVAQTALDNLERFPFKIRDQIIKRMNALVLDPHPPGSIKLQGVKSDYGEPVYRQRSGDYRILYVVRNKLRQVMVIDIDHRKNVYRVEGKRRPRRTD